MGVWELLRWLNLMLDYSIVVEKCLLLSLRERPQQDYHILAALQVITRSFLFAVIISELKVLLLQ